MQDFEFGDRRVPQGVWDNLRESTTTGCWGYVGNRYTGSGWPRRYQVSLWRYLYKTLVGPVPPTVTMICETNPKDCMNPYHRLSPYGMKIPPHTCSECGRGHNPDEVN